MKKLLIHLMVLLPAVLAAQGKEVISTGSQQLAGFGISISATIGEVCVNVPQGRDAYATAGFQQGFLPAESSVLRNPDVATVFQAEVFPNPAVDRVQVVLPGAKGQSTRLRLYNNLGVLIQETDCSSEQYTFDIALLPAGPYWMAIQPADAKQAITLPFAKINR